VRSDSSVACWGYGGFGQLGNGSRDDRRVPTAALSALKFAAVSAGIGHTCALTTDSTAYCWGRNNFGQLGDTTFADTTQPVAVRGDLKFTGLTLGFNHSCALTAEGSAYCWGDNQLGQLGDTVIALSSVPVPVDGGFVFRALSAGAAHTCGITTGNAARCWGAGAEGQLGSPPTHNCAGPSAAGPCSPLPQAVAGGYTFTAISAGNHHTCAIATDQRVYCWGLNSNGQLGSGSTSVALRP